MTAATVSYLCSASLSTGAEHQSVLELLAIELSKAWWWWDHTHTLDVLWVKARVAVQQHLQGADRHQSGSTRVHANLYAHAHINPHNCSAKPSNPTNQPDPSHPIPYHQAVLPVPIQPPTSPRTPPSTVSPRSPPHSPGAPSLRSQAHPPA